MHETEQRRQDEVWKSDSLVRTFLDGVRGGVPLAAEQIDVMLRVLEAGGTPLRSFADLGCGNGILARAILARHPAARATLLDFSKPMLAAAHENLGDQVSRVVFVEADFGLPAWRATIGDRARFDAIVSGYAIHHQPDARKQALYGEIFDLLNPGGIFINVEHVASRSPWIESVSDNLFIDSMYGFHSHQGTGKTREQVAHDFVMRPDKAANILAPVEVQCEWLRACGFEDVDCFFKVFELAVFGGRRPR